jgi:hypothetical protein
VLPASMRAEALADPVLPPIPPNTPPGLRAEIDVLAEAMTNDYADARRMAQIPGVPVAVVIAAPPGRLKSPGDVLLRLQLRHQAEWALRSANGLILVSGRVGQASVAKITSMGSSATRSKCGSLRRARAPVTASTGTRCVAEIVANSRSVHLSKRFRQSGSSFPAASPYRMASSSAIRTSATRWRASEKAGWSGGQSHVGFIPGRSAHALPARMIKVIRGRRITEQSYGSSVDVPATVKSVKCEIWLYPLLAIHRCWQISVHPNSGHRGEQ